jgi:hypothetical protein
MVKVLTRNKRAFSLSFKLSVVKAYETRFSYNLSLTARKFKIDRAVIRRWVKNKDSLLRARTQSEFKNVPNFNMNCFKILFYLLGLKKNLSTKTRCFFPQLETRLDECIIELRSKGIVVTGNRIIIEAKKIANELGFTNFQGSKGWLRNFLSRKCYTLRKINCKGKDLPKDIAITKRGFIETCKEKRANYSRAQIYGWDESYVEIDSPEMYTYDKKGKGKICAITTGQHKTKVSFGVVASADGEKLEPVFVIPRKRPLKDAPEGCLIVYKGKSKTFDSEIIKDHFLNRLLYPHMLKKGQDSAMLIWDQANPHKTAPVMKELKRLNVEDVKIDKCCTAWEQPADAYWFSPMKKK